MRITRYSFGSITVGDKTYTSDVIIFPDKISSSWWRKEGHYLQSEDLEEVVGSGIKFLVIGTGASGVMQVPQETFKFLASNGIEVYALRTPEAVEMYNKLEADKPVVAALHLTC
jgi:hypothetical protein